jgi:quinol monooxygenase YgiN
MSQLTGVVTIVAKEGREEELEAMLARIHAAAITDDGCDVYTITKPRKIEGTFVIFEAYRDRDALVRHQQNPTLAELGALLGDIAASVTVQLGSIVVGDRVAADR